VLALVLVAVALGLANFAAAIGIGVSGVDSRTRWRVGIVFGLFEAGMPVVGLVLGRSLADELGAASESVAGALLIATGGYALWQALRGPGDRDGKGRGGADGDSEGDGDEQAPGPELSWDRLLLTGLALSLDNLAVGFSLGAEDVALATAAAVIGAVSLGLSLVGLELGARIGERSGRRGELLGAAVLIAVGIAVAAGAI
jgi:putative Mn2+ efflux pump MntP